MLIVNIFSFVNVLILVGSIELWPSRRTYHLERLDGSCRGENVPMRTVFRITKHDTKLRVIYFNATLNITEDLPGEKQLISKITRCRSKESLDTCEPFITTKPEDYCARLNPDDDKLVNMKLFDIRYTPEYRCPIKKGIYRAYNGKFDYKPSVIFPLGSWYWKAVSEVREVKTKRLVSCMHMEAF